MRAFIPFVALVALSVTTGCPNKELHASIEEMNRGIKAAQSGSIETAIKHLDEATRLYPDNHQAWWNLGQLYFRDKKWEEAIESLSEAVRINGKDSMYQMRLGIAYYESGNRSQAATHLEEAAELENRLATAYYYLGLVYEDNDEPRKAAEAWSQAARIDPYEGKSFVRLGKIYLTWDMVDHAIKVLQLGAQYVKGDERTNVLHYLGLAYDAQGAWDSAIEAYSQALDADSGNLDARFQRGLSYVKKGDKSKARADLEEYVKSARGSSASNYNKQEANKVLFALSAQ